MGWKKRKARRTHFKPPGKYGVEIRPKICSEIGIESQGPGVDDEITPN